MNEESTLKTGEIHPSAGSAMSWLHEWQIADLRRWAVMREAVASTALSGNRLAEICHGTLERLDKNEPISDRYLLGLCWFLKELYQSREEKI